VGLLLRILLGVGSAIAANRAVKKSTGESVSDKAFGWWNDMREKVSVWIAENPDQPIERVSAKLAHVMDSGVQALARLQIRGESEGREVTIREEEIPLDELRKQFPSLQKEGDSVELDVEPQDPH
jgi:hypothetical protein